MLKQVLGLDLGETRKKKRYVSIKDVRTDRYSFNQFIERKSLLDQIYSDSSISQSSFKGIMRMVMFVTSIYVINNYVVRSQIRCHFMVNQLIYKAKVLFARGVHCLRQT